MQYDSEKRTNMSINAKMMTSMLTANRSVGVGERATVIPPRRNHQRRSCGDI